MLIRSLQPACSVRLHLPVCNERHLSQDHTHRVMLMPFGNSRGQGFNNPVISKFQAGSIYMDSTGLYVYDGTPGLGVPLVTSDSDSSVDPFGNPIAPGVVVYTSPTQAIQIADGFITYMVYSGGSWSAECTLSLGAGGFSIHD